MPYGVYVQYGKNKGKEREERPPTAFATHVAHTLSISTGTTSAHTKRATTTAPSPLSGSSRSAGPSILRTQHEHSHIPLPSKVTHSSTINAVGTLDAPPSPRSRNHPLVGLKTSESPQVSPRKPTDSVTYVPCPCHVCEAVMEYQ